MDAWPGNIEEMRAWLKTRAANIATERDTEVQQEIADQVVTGMEILRRMEEKVDPS